MTTRIWDIDILSTADIEKLIGACSRRAPSGLRDRALIALLAGAGLRLAEALALLPKDLDLDACKVTVQRGKGSKRRVIGMGPLSMAIVAEWLTRRQKLGATRSQPVICLITKDKVGEEVSQDAVRAMLRRRKKHAKLDRRVHAHGLRHSFAVELLNRGANVLVIMNQLGHSNLAVTSVYLDHLSNGDTAATVRDLMS